MLNFLFCLLILLSVLFCERRSDRIAICVFSLGGLTFSSIGDKLDNGTVYHALAYCFDLLIIFTLSKLSNVSSVVTGIQKICLHFIYVNFVGWVAYMLYFPPTIYNWACSILYVWALFIILARRNTNADRNNAMDRRYFSFHSRDITGGIAIQTNKKEARN